MSRLISFVSPDSSCEPRDESKNFKMKNSCPQRDSNPLTKLALYPTELWVPSDCRHFKVTDIHMIYYVYVMDSLSQEDINQHRC